MKVKNQVNVVLLSPLPPPLGGIATWTKTYLENASKNNIYVELINTQKLPGFLGEIKRTIRIFKQIKRSIKKKRASVFHLNCACGKLGLFRDYWCLKKIHKAKFKSVLHFHCDLSKTIGNSKIRRRIVTKMCNFASFNMVLNDASKKILETLECKNIILMSNFVDDYFLEPFEKEYSDKIENVIFVGRIVKEKGVFEIIDTARQNPQILFTLIGPAEHNADKLIGYVPSNVRFLGPKTKKEIRRALRSSDVFLLPTYSEGLSISIMEAMASKMPIITTDVGGNKSMIENKGGLLIPMKNSAAISQAINKMMNKDTRIKMGEWNHKKCEKEFSTESVMKALKIIYSKALDF